jgi:hypothetical protein
MEKNQYPLLKPKLLESAPDLFEPELSKHLVRILGLKNQNHIEKIDSMLLYPNFPKLYVICDI